MDDLFRIPEFWAALLGAAVGGISSVIGGFILHRWIENLKHADQLRAVVLSTAEALVVMSDFGAVRQGYRQYVKFLASMPREWESRFGHLALKLHRVELFIETLKPLMDGKTDISHLAANEGWKEFIGGLEDFARAAHDAVESFEWWRVSPHGSIL